MVQQNFADRLVAAIQKKDTPICVGLDPRLSKIPAAIRNRAIKKKGKTHEAAADAILEFNKGIIDAVADIVPVVKPQIAFYELFGFPGIWAFEETCKYAQDKGLIVIADAKRNDIGSTAEAYAEAFIGEVDIFGARAVTFDADAVTVTPYLGYDGIKPFVDVARQYGTGAFILVKTSNPSSGDLQDKEVVEKNFPVHQLVANLVESWGSDLIGVSGYSSIGAVVGATYKAEAKVLRQLMPNSFFLVPGYGAQGATADDISPCFNRDGLGAVVNSSRAIIFAYEGNDKYGEDGYADAARKATLQMKEDVAGAI